MSGAEDDALYAGFDEMASSAAIHQTVHATATAVSPQAAGGGYAGAAPTTAMRPPTSLPPSEMARPMTSAAVRGAGYGAAPATASSRAAAAGGGEPGAVPDENARRDEDEPEEPRDAVKRMERGVHRLLEASASLAARGDAGRALDKAKEAARRERQMGKFKAAQAQALADHPPAEEDGQAADAADAFQPNHDLSFAVLLHLGNCYVGAGLFDEAVSTLTVLVKNRTLPNAAARARANLARVYETKGDLPSAVKMYRMAADQLGHGTGTKYRIMASIGSCLAKMGEYAQAVTSYEGALDGEPDPRTAFNLLVCQYALGDLQSLRAAFLRLLAVHRTAVDEGLVAGDEGGGGVDGAGIGDSDDEDGGAGGAGIGGPSAGLGGTGRSSSSARRPGSGGGGERESGRNRGEGGGGGGDGGGGDEDDDSQDEDAFENGTGARSRVEHLEARATDELKKELQARRRRTNRYVLQAAKLIAPKLGSGGDDLSGFDWVVEQLRGAGLRALATEIGIVKGLGMLKLGRVAQAIEVFKGFERADGGGGAGMVDQAANNLSFLYFLEEDYKSAERYADVAGRADRYNARALVNKANVLFVGGHAEAAKELYLEAIGVETDCVEAIYNLGLVYKRTGNLDRAMQAFKKLHRILPKDQLTTYHIASIYEQVGNSEAAVEWFKILQGSAPTDPRVLARLGALHSRLDDENAALHHYTDSYAAYPNNMEVVSWLGVWYVQSELYENAIEFFERAAEIEPDEVKWRLMIATCYRRMGAFQAALNLYRQIHAEDPDNVECLRFLCSLCKDTNDPDYDKYVKLYGRAERMRDANAREEEERQRQQQQQQQQQHAPYESAPRTHDDYAAGVNRLNDVARQEEEERRRQTDSRTREGAGYWDDAPPPETSAAGAGAGVGLDAHFKEPIPEGRPGQMLDRKEAEDVWAGEDLDDFLPL